MQLNFIEYHLKLSKFLQNAYAYLLKTKSFDQFDPVDLDLWVKNWLCDFTIVLFFSILHCCLKGSFISKNYAILLWKEIIREKNSLSNGTTYHP